MIAPLQNITLLLSVRSTIILSFVISDLQRFMEACCNNGLSFEKEEEEEDNVVI